MPTSVQGIIPQALTIDQVSKRYGANATAVDNISIKVPAGTLLGLLGPSGCGKTTLLRMIAGLIPTTSGSICIGTEDITNVPVHARDIGLVFQSYALFPHMTIEQNVAFGLKMRKVSKKETRDRVQEALEMVRLSSLNQRKPKELSGGQQQRVALARALVIRPKVLLLDEPLSNLDAKLRDEMRQEIMRIQRSLSITTVFVTHDQAEALTMCDLVGVMSAGKLQQLGTPTEVYEKPQSLFVSQFVGRTNAFPCRTQGRHVHIGSHSYLSNNEHEGPGMAVIRPHRITLSPIRDRALVASDVNVLTGKIAQTSYIGDIISYVVEGVDGTRLTVEAPTISKDNLFKVGSPVMCEWAPHNLQVFKG